MKSNLLDIQNPIRTFKVMLVGILTSLVLSLPIMFGNFLFTKELTVVAVIIGFLTVIVYLFLFGFLLNKLYKWK